MKTRLYLDTRASGDGAAPLKIGITENGKTAYISLGVRLLPSEFITMKGGGWSIVGRPDRQRLTNYIRGKQQAIETAMLSARYNGELVGKDATQIRDYLVKAISPDAETRTLFLPYFRQYNDDVHTGRTHDIYRYTIDRIAEYDPHAEELTLEDVTPIWLEGFSAFMRTRQKDIYNANGTNIHLRNIRAVMNHAVHRSHVTTNYPFDEFAIRNVDTAKRALDVETLRRLFRTPVDAGLERYLDMLKLMFLLRGINIVDLCHAKKADVRFGRLEYVRAKTHMNYSVKIEPEAQAIIDKYAGRGEYLLNIMDTNSSYLSFARNMARRIKLIGAYKDKDGNMVLPFAYLTGYYMRHSFATIQVNDNHEDIYTVSKGLGHQYGSKTTAVYVDFDQARADEANRRLIDWVLYGKRTK